MKQILNTYLDLILDDYHHLQYEPRLFATYLKENFEKMSEDLEKEK